jgi:hypothetical protein
MDGPKVKMILRNDLKKFFWWIQGQIGVANPGPDPNFFHPGSRIRIRQFKYFFNQKIISNLSETWSGGSIPDHDLGFLPIPDPGVKNAPDLGSATLLCQNLRRKDGLAHKVFLKNCYHLPGSVCSAGQRGGRNISSCSPGTNSLMESHRSLLRRNP